MSKLKAKPKRVKLIDVPPEPGDCIDVRALSPAQLDAMFAEAEKVGLEDLRPLTRSQKAIHARLRERARKAGRLGRPRVGKGAQRINVTIERGLLERADRFAAKQQMTRAELIARGLRLAMAG